MPPLGPPPRHPVRAGDLRQPLLGRRPRIHHVLQDHPQQLPALHDHLLLDLIKRPVTGPRPGQLARQDRQLPHRPAQARRHHIGPGRKLRNRIPFHLEASLPARSGFDTTNIRNGSLSAAQHPKTAQQFTPEKPHPCGIEPHMTGTL